MLYIVELGKGGDRGEIVNINVEDLIANLSEDRIVELEE